MRSRTMNTPKFRYTSIGLFLLLLFTAGCAVEQEAEGPAAEIREATLKSNAPDPFGDYWYQGEAEITSYELEQARYGSMHDGEAVLIFVTEDFSKTKQVKLDNPFSAGEDKVGVLKLNATKNFNTGIYPYSMMTSVFTPIHRKTYPHSLKITTTSQEWCGHTYTQFNLRENQFAVQFNSYFESEGDQQIELKTALLEDEVWTLIRLEPESLPTGTIKAIPGSMYQRLSHTDFRLETATAQLNAVEGREGVMAYSLYYPETNRALTIHFSEAFPHEIEGWEERTKSGFGPNAEMLTTRATMKKRIKLDYWSRNQPQDEALREQLDLK